MEITKVEVRNVMGIHYALVEPKSSGATIVGGKNESGKTSFLESAAMTIGGAALCPKKPIMDGENHAECKVSLNGDPLLNLPACDVVRTWNRKEDGSFTTTLQIKTGNSVASGPQGILDKVIGKIGFNPNDFLRAEKSDQVKILRELVGIDFTGLDEEYAELFRERTGLNRDVESLATRHNAATFHPTAPEQPVSVSELMAELKRLEAEFKSNDEVRREANAAARSHDECVSGIAKLQQAVEDAKDAMQTAETNLENAQEGLVEHEAELATAQAKSASLVDPDCQAVRDQIEQADELNRKQRENAAKKVLRDQHTAAVLKADAATKRLKEIIDEKAKSTAAAKWPIDGLGFSDNGVTFDGRELKQAAASRQIMVAIAIRAALSPSLRFAIIHDGSLLDEDKLAEVSLFAESKNMQLLIERVGSGAECDIVISEGRVVGQSEPKPMAEPAKAKRSKKTLLDE